VRIYQLFVSAAFFPVTLLVSGADSLAITDAPASDNVQIQVRDGLLTVNAEDVPLDQLLRAIGKQAGFDVVIEGNLSAPVNRSFADLPVEQGIRQLVKGTSFIIFYSGSSEANRLSLLRVYPVTKSGGAQTVQPGVTATGDPTQTDLEQWVRIRLFKSERGTRIVAVRKLTELETEVAVEIAAQVLEYDDDPIVRGEAVAVLGALGGDSVHSVLKVALVDPAASVRHRAIRALGTVGGEQATSILGQVLLGYSNQEMRLMALRALIEISNEGSRYYVETAASDQDLEVREVAQRGLEHRRRGGPTGSTVGSIEQSGGDEVVDYPANELVE